MNLFGRKQIRELEQTVDRLTANLRNEAAEHAREEGALRNQIEYLVRTIRDIDQEIWNMSQRTDWNGMRPHFNKIQDGMTARKVAESNRIGDILRGELIDTYKPTAKQIGNG